MTRSIILNQVVKSALLDAGTIIINDGGENHHCHNFKHACEIIDSVEECFISCLDRYTGKSYGWLHVIPELEGDEQIADYSLGNRLTNIIEKATARYSA